MNTTDKLDDRIMHRSISNETSFYLWWILIGIFSSFLITELISPALSRIYCKSYESISRKQYLEWNARWLSTVHSIFILLISFYCLLFNKKMHEDKFFYSDFLSNVGMCISCGYMIYDSLTMIMYLKGASLWTYIIHHSIVIWGSSAFLSNEIGKYYAYLKYLTELSTPFINLRWFLRTCGYSSHHKYVAIATSLFAVTFILTRNICAVPFWYLVSYNIHHHTSEAQRIFLIDAFKIYFILGIILDILNLFWGAIICSMLWQSIKVLKNSQCVESE
ncbi:hypothetical protein MS3_00003356 [Schistosoma haematobium]|uniref:TLC domain-containing protein n=1 Tax=Schistosoma haematobium TaxID=6185 RepID=A0A922LP85_SCHHA|nr:hypothetical protein MS3_00003356 [Schistosoma haematobium]KAH9590833.1 hypothetical protein MS3_00003356 [Schistosoma haematobium]CAH8648160.1 unnamed protein product [Schistosoma bovis]CAH8662522.1 unnamed protein product [Schistosoma haematobium]CAH8670033.1 unnamed protein product [Schistosoma haematobium]